MKKIIFIFSLYAILPMPAMQSLRNKLNQLRILLKKKMLGGYNNALFSTKDKHRSEGENGYLEGNLLIENYKKEYLDTIETDTLDILKEKQAAIENLLEETSIRLKERNNQKQTHQEYFKQIILCKKTEALHEIKILLNTQISILNNTKFHEAYHNAFEKSNALTKYYNTKYLHNIDRQNIVYLRNTENKIFNLVSQKKRDLREVMIKYNEDFLNTPITDYAISNYQEKIILSEEIKTLDNIRSSFNNKIIEKINAYQSYYENINPSLENKPLNKTMNQLTTIEETNTIEELKIKQKDVLKQLKILKNQINAIHKKTAKLQNKPINKEKIIQIDKIISSIDSHYLLKTQLLYTIEKKIQRMTDNNKK
jgi:hypothetical protein